MALASPLRKLAKPSFLPTNQLDNPYVESPLANLPGAMPGISTGMEPEDDEAPEEDAPINSPLASMASPDNDTNNPPDSADDTAPSQAASETTRSRIGELSADKQYQTPILDRLEKMYATEYPNPDDYKPSLGRRILAGIAAGSGASAAGISGGQMVGFRDDVKEGIAARNEVLEGPLNRATKRFNDRAAGLTKAAEVEGKRISNYRTVENQTERNQILSDRNAVEREKITAKAEADLRKANDARDKAVNDLAEKKREADLDKSNQDRIAAVREAEQRATAAQHASALAELSLKNANAYSELLRKHDDERARMEAAAAAEKKRADTAEAALTTQTVTKKSKAIEDRSHIFGIPVPWTGHEVERTTTEKQPTKGFVNPNAPAPPPAAAAPAANAAAPPAAGAPPASPKKGDTWNSPTGVRYWDGSKWAVNKP